MGNLKKKFLKSGNGLFITGALLAALAVFSLLSAIAGKPVRADGALYTPLNGTTVTARTDGGVHATLAIPDADNISITYNKALSAAEPIYLYVNPVQSDGTYISVLLFSDAAHTNRRYAFNVTRQSASMVNLRTQGGIWDSFGSNGGADEYKIEFDDDYMHFYLNGALLQSWAAGKNAFASGVHLQFGSGAYYWAAFGPEVKLEADIRIGNPAAVTQFRHFTHRQTAALTYEIALNGAAATRVSLQKAGGAVVHLEPAGYTLTDTALTVGAVYLSGLLNGADTGDYTITIVNPARNITLALNVGNGTDMEFGVPSIGYDQYVNAGKDLTLPLYLNTDGFNGISGNGIGPADYVYDGNAELLTVRAGYLASLSYGVKSFKLYTVNQPSGGNGIDFTVTISDTAPPSVAAPLSPEFDRFAPADLAVTMDMYQNTFASVTGDGMTPEDYSFDTDSGVLTIKKEYLSALAPNTTRHFTFTGTHGGVDIPVKIIHSEPAVLTSGGIFEVNRSSPIDARFTLDMKYDSFVRVTGHGIASGEYTFDAETGLLTIARGFIGAAFTTDGDKTFMIVTRYNPVGIAAAISVYTANPPVLSQGASVANFEKQTGTQSLVYKITLNMASLLRVYGSGIDGNGYASSVTAGVMTVTLLPPYLQTLRNGTNVINVEFDNGLIVLTVNVTNSLAPALQNGAATIYIKAPDNADYALSVVANRGVFTSVTGNGITAADYSFNAAAGAVTFKKEYLRTIPFELPAPFNVNFDNGVLRAYITYSPKYSPSDLYVFDGSANGVTYGAMTDDNGAVKVSYRPKTGDAILLGGVKAKYQFDVSKPIELYVNFTAFTQKAGYSYIFSIASDTYKMFYGSGSDEAELFGAFSVSDRYIMNAYFGKNQYHGGGSSQIPHELLARKGGGQFEQFIFDIGENDTAIYYNGRLIRRFSQIKRGSFTDGKAYVLFSPFTYVGLDIALPDLLEYSFKANGKLAADTDYFVVNTHSAANLDINVNMDGSVLKGIYYVDGAIEREITGYTVSQDYGTGAARIRFPADAVRFNEYFAAGGEYLLRIRNDDGYTDVTLRVSSAEKIEIVSRGDLYFDKNAPRDLTIKVMENMDAFASLTGDNGITSSDYTCSAGLLTIKKEFLSALSIGAYAQRLVSALDTNGQSFTVYVVDMTPPALADAVKEFDRQSPGDIVFGIDPKFAVSLSLSGKGISPADYSYSLAEQKITVKESWLDRLDFGAYALTVKVGYGIDVYNDVSVTVRVINSLKPVFGDGGDAFVLDVTAGKDVAQGDVSVAVNFNKGKILRIDGCYITADLYEADYTAGTVIFYAEWLRTLAEGDNQITIRADNGDLTVTVRVAAPQTPGDGGDGSGGNPDGGGCRSAANTISILSAALILAFGKLVIRRRSV
ncbi:hypothetical protein FACS1894211_04010 [Clostridia bacterium]|nr:hypothetical protein FACS1894211_04010 [Clostridia bacterium]